MLHYVLGEVLHCRVPALLETEQVCDEAYDFCLESLADVSQPLPRAKETPHEDWKQVFRYGVEVSHEPVGVV